MKFSKILFFLLATATFGLVSCEENDSTSFQVGSDHVSFVPMPAAIIVPDDETVTIEAKVYASEAKSTDRVLELEVKYQYANPQYANVTTADPEYFNVPASVTIPAGEKVGTFNVSVTGVGLNVEGKKIVIEFKKNSDINVPGFTIGTVEDPNNFDAIWQPLIITVKSGCFKNSFQVQISTDRYGEETSWELYDSAGNLMGQGGPYTRGAANGVYPQPASNFCLDNGNYTFIVYDSEDDGMDSGYGAGFYRLVKIVDGQEIEIAKNGVFGAFDEVMFSLP